MAFEQDQQPEQLQQAQQSKLDRLAMALERARIGEYVELMQQPLRVIYISFLSGLARGFGIIIGFTVIGAAVIYILQRVVALNLPGISRAIADLIRLVQQNMVR